LNIFLEIVEKCWTIWALAGNFLDTLINYNNFQINNFQKKKALWIFHVGMWNIKNINIIILWIFRVDIINGISDKKSGTYLFFLININNRIFFRMKIRKFQNLFFWHHWTQLVKLMRKCTGSKPWILLAEELRSEYFFTLEYIWKSWTNHIRKFKIFESAIFWHRWIQLVVLMPNH
jgi:hypothetical protein